MSKLHIYGQHYNHSDAWIVGDTEALTLLRDALNDVLQERMVRVDTGFEPKHETLSGVRSFCEDGEGYTTLILRLEDNTQWEQLLLPYNEWADHRGDSKHPFDFVEREDYRSVVRQ